MKASRVLIKLGGAALSDPSTRDSVTGCIRKFRAAGLQVVLVHGGGPAINAELRKAGIEWTFVGGQRVTTPEMISVIESTLCGQVNGSLVRHFGARGLPAIGLAGTDGQLLLCRQSSAALGLVGQIEQVNASWVQALLAAGLLPVIAPVGVGSDGECYNINADWAASHLAVALQVEQMIFLTDQPGILDEEGQVIRTVDFNGLHNMVEARMVSGGMLTKTLSIAHALKNGVRLVRVMNSQNAAEDVPYGVLGTTCVSAIALSKKSEVEQNAVL